MIETFPLRWAIIWAVIVGAVYFIPQALHLQRAHTPTILLEENYDEIAYAVWASREAGEHSGQPDPYQLLTNKGQSISFATIQFLPPFLLGSLARILHLPVTTIFFAGSFFFPAVAGFLFILIAWCCGVREPWQLALSVTFSLLMLTPALWLMQWRYITSLMADNYPGFRLTLPYSRRSHPQFISIFHYAAIAFSLLAVLLPPGLKRWVSGLIAGIAFGLSFYCYYFSWTLLVGWFVLGGFFIWLWHRDSINVWLASFILGCVIAVPYFSLVLQHYDDISASAAAAKTYAFPQDPAIQVTLLICVVLAFALWLERKSQVLFWPLLVLNLAAVLGALQNVVTGTYTQPYHYLHYFARPTTNLSLLILCVWLFQRYKLNKKFFKKASAAKYVILLIIILIAAIFQWARYREVSSLAQVSIAAQPAFKALRNYAEPGSLVFCPQAIVREAVPLYTNSVSFFSVYMLLSENNETKPLVHDRIVGTQWLIGMSAKDFSYWLSTNPIEVYFQHLQRRIDERNETYMHERADALRSRFETVQSQTFASLRYALLPATTQIETTRLPVLFQVKKLWADDNYSLFALTLK